MSPSQIDFFRHIEHECAFILRVSTGKTKEDIVDDELLGKAIVRSLEIIGEAVKRLPEDLKRQYQDIDWKPIAGMRDVLIHHYFGIDYDVIWTTITVDIPALHKEIRKIIEAER